MAGRTRMTSGLRLGGLIGAATLLADQLLKVWVVFFFDLPAKGRVEVLPFFDLVMVWNRGISYGLFQQDTFLGRAILVAVSVIACGFILFWLRSPMTKFQAVALGLILGGAAGNGIDRAVYGAVADFVLLYGFGFEWYVFNIADAAIVVGVALILYGAVFRGDRTEAA